VGKRGLVLLLETKGTFQESESVVVVALLLLLLCLLVLWGLLQKEERPMGALSARAYVQL